MQEEQNIAQERGSLNTRKIYCRGSRDGAVAESTRFHQRGPGSIPGLAVICGLGLLLVLILALRPAFSGVLQFSPLLKNKHLQFDLGGATRLAFCAKHR